MQFYFNKELALAYFFCILFFVILIPFFQGFLPVVPHPGLLVIFLLFFAAGLFLILLGMANYLIVRRIINTPTSKVRSVAVGLVEIRGKAKSSTENTSPISGKKCACWFLEGHYYLPDKKAYEKLFDLTSPEPFFLEDNTGAILVDPKGAFFDIPARCSTGSSATGEFDEGLSDALEKIEDKTVQQALAEHSHDLIRVTEYYISENEPLYIFGTAKIRKGAASQVAHENIFIGEGEHDNFFYIRNSSEKKIIDELRKPIRWQILGGLLLWLVASLSLFAK